MCALGLALGFRANVWNIGAEGQLIVGAIVGGGIGLYFDQAQGAWLLPLMLIGGALGGMAWAAIPAFLRTRFHTSEILVSLMLVYVAQLLLSYLVHGPWRDPAGYNFPQSPVFSPAATVPVLMEGVRTNLAFVLALLLAALAWVFAEKTFAGFRLKVSGLAPDAASYAGFSEKRNVWLALLISGATAGLAGVAEVAGPIGQLQPSISPGYGFAAIIVAFVGPPASARRGARQPADVAALHRRRDRADQDGAAGGGDGPVPGDAAVLPAGGGPVHSTSGCAGPRGRGAMAHTVPATESA